MIAQRTTSRAHSEEENMPIAPYGSWKSPITASLLTSAGNSLSEIQFANGNVYWLEGRPIESGRVAIVCAGPDRKPTDGVPTTFNARTRVHEYGGGAYCLNQDTIFFS